MTHKKTEKQKTDKEREAPISYHPPAALREEFLARVERSGLSTNAFLTKAVFGPDSPRRSRRPPLEKALLARLLGEAAHIRDTLHEIALTRGDTPANGASRPGGGASAARQDRSGRRRSEHHRPENTPLPKTHHGAAEDILALSVRLAYSPAAGRCRFDRPTVSCR